MKTSMQQQLQQAFNISKSPESSKHYNAMKRAKEQARRLRAQLKNPRPVQYHVDSNIYCHHGTTTKASWVARYNRQTAELKTQATA
tara:strand:+ start:198 stop:455 length:258 start_codon:yes stop_codon:yes gene_type:complete